jgi:outer membrane immunogenic protein
MMIRHFLFPLCALVLLGLAPRAYAADIGDDFDVLRGSQVVGPATFTRWSGFYLGGQIGYSNASADFGSSTQQPLANVLRSSSLEADSDPSALVVLGSTDHTAAAYGGFVGYNTQWQDLILGIEANYNYTPMTLTAPNSPIARGGFTDSSGNSYLIGASANGTITNLNYGSLRARAGWDLGNFLPYGFVGLALGVADISVAAAMSGTCQAGSSATCQSFGFIATAGHDSEVLYGFSIGGGFDYAVTQNVFLRGEFEYTQFAAVENILLAIYSARAGVGFKF